MEGVSSKGVSIDLGTANTVVWDVEHGMLYNEPTMMALSFNGGRHSDVIGVGHAAEELVGRAPDGVEVVRPLRDGVITDLETTRRFLREILQDIAPSWLQRRRLSVVIGTPAGASPLERRALLEAAEEAGIGKAHLLPEPVCGAVGCGIDPMQPRAHLVVDIGGGTSEVCAFGSGGMLAYRTSPLAGDEMTLALYQYLRSEHQLVVGERIAEQVKIRAFSDPEPVDGGGRPRRRHRQGPDRQPRSRGSVGGREARHRGDHLGPDRLPRGPRPAERERRHVRRRDHRRRRLPRPGVRQARSRTSSGSRR